MAAPPEIPVQVLTPQQLRARRSRSLAIAFALGALVILFFAMTIVRIGGAAMQASP